jgi:hypothetical protein
MGSAVKAPQVAYQGTETQVIENGSEMNHRQRLIYNLFHASKDNEGLNIDSVCQTLKSQIPPDETRFRLFSLCN